jgi:hypothetical protein
MKVNYVFEILGQVKHEVFFVIINVLLIFIFNHILVIIFLVMDVKSNKVVIIEERCHISRISGMLEKPMEMREKCREM